MSYTYTLPLPLAIAAPVASDTLAAKGVVYTQRWVVELMLDLAGFVSSKDLGANLALEPAAGTGSFLVPMVERLIASCLEHDRAITDCTTALLAYELDPESARQARITVVEKLMQAGLAIPEAQRLADAWIRTGDFLVEAPTLPRADWVIGNPPYIRLEDIAPDRMAFYRKMYRTMIGRADLYVAFFEAALRGLKVDGKCVFICADRWMLNQYGAELRRMITSQFAVELVLELHRVEAFASTVSAYPAITLLRHRRQGSTVVASAAPEINRLNPVQIHHALTESGASTSNTRTVLKTARIGSWFTGAEPWPCTSPDRLALLKDLEARFAPLVSTVTGTKVGIGVATGADDVFITHDEDLVEAERLLPLAMAAGIRSGKLRWTGAYLVNPWQPDGLVELRQFPKLAAYFHQHEAKLRDRHVGKRNSSGWYRTIDRVEPRLRSQSKLYIADIKHRLVPVLDSGTTYPHHNLYWIISSQWDLEVLGGLLISDLAQFFVECYSVRLRGGYLRFQAQYLRRIRLPDPAAIPTAQAIALREAFRAQDRAAASSLAMAIYGITHLPAADPP